MSNSSLLVKPRVPSETTSCSYNSYSTALTSESRLRFEKYGEEDKIDSDVEEQPKLRSIAEELYANSSLGEQTDIKAVQSISPFDDNKPWQDLTQDDLDTDSALESAGRHELNLSFSDETTIFTDYFGSSSKQLSLNTRKSMCQSFQVPSRKYSEYSESSSPEKKRTNTDEYGRNNQSLVWNQSVHCVVEEPMSPKKKSIPQETWTKPKRKISQPVKFDGSPQKLVCEDKNLVDHAVEQMCRRPTKIKAVRRTNLQKSSSCSNFNTEKGRDSSPTSGFYRCDYKFVVEDRECERNMLCDSITKKKSSKDGSNCIHIRKVWNVEENKAYAFVVQTFHSSRYQHFIDINRHEERRSDDPFIVYKKGTDYSANPEFTNVQAIDFQKLLDKIICPHRDDYTFEEKRIKMKRVFLATYDMVCSSTELFREIMRRFFVPTPSCMSRTEAVMFERVIKEPAQMKSIRLLLDWIYYRETDFIENLYLSQLLNAFLSFAICVSSEFLVKELHKVKSIFAALLDQKKKDSESETIGVINWDVIKLTSSPLFDKSWYISNKRGFDIEYATKMLFTHTSEDFSCQLTLMDSYLHQEIRPWHMPYNLKNKARNQPVDKTAYVKMIEQTNFRTFFFVFLIIAQSTEDKKLEVVARLLDIAEKSLQLRNYQNFCCIIGALTNMAVLIQRTNYAKLSLVSKKRKLDFESMYKRVAKLRKEIKEAPLPMVPSLLLVGEGTEQLMAAQSASLELDDRKLMNFKLMEELRDVSEKFFTSQKSNYKFQPIPKILDFIQSDVMQLMKLLNNDLNPSKIQAHLMRFA